MSGVALFGVTALAMLGAVFLGLGGFLLVKGFAASRMITAALLEEDATAPSTLVLATTPADADAAPARPPHERIRDARSAQLRIDEIKGRTLHQMGPFQKLPYEGGERQTFLNGLAIRTALSLAVMGYGVSNLVIAMGATLLVLGAASLALGIPLVYAIDG
jgi:hypothetical protein